MALQRNLDITGGGESIQTGPRGSDTVSWSGIMSTCTNSYADFTIYGTACVSKASVMDYICIF
jgi:hypothetical protein